MHKEFRGGGSKGVLGVGSKVQFWGPISLCLCAFLGLENLHLKDPKISEPFAIGPVQFR